MMINTKEIEKRREDKEKRKERNDSCHLEGKSEKEICNQNGEEDSK